MKTIISGKTVAYRTKLFTRFAAAQSFAKCLAANSRFAGVRIVPSKSSGKWWVEYRPTSRNRQLEITADQQRRRIKTARAEGRAYQWRPVGTDAWLCTNPHSSRGVSVNEVSLRHCTCEDFQFKAGPAGILCKHQVALADKPAQESENAPPRAA